MAYAAMVFLGGALIASQAAKLWPWVFFVAEFIMLTAGLAARRLDGVRTYANAWIAGTQVITVLVVLLFAWQLVFG